MKNKESSFSSYTINDLENIALEIITNCNESKLFCLKGDLGAGKTSLIKHLIRALGCEDEVTSPTYSIINEYSYGNDAIYHMDLYRLTYVEEALDLGILDYLDGDSYCFIEWPELILPIIDSYFEIEISKVDNSTRELVISSY